MLPFHGCVHSVANAGAPRAAPLAKDAMNLQSLTVVTAICALSHHLETDSEDVFAISPAVG
jgi:hypothetical protein